MARPIDFSKLFVPILTNLKSNSVRETSSIVGISYASLCKFLHTYQVQKVGVLNKQISLNDDFQFMLESLHRHNTNPNVVAPILGITTRRLQRYAKQLNIKFAWELAESENLQQRIGRKAEEFVKSLPEFTILKDSAKYHTTSPHDLIIKGVGGVDIKSTKLRKTPEGTCRWKFNVSSSLHKTSRQVKAYYLVGYDESYSKPLILLCIPARDLGKHVSISVCMESLAKSKYAPYVHATYNGFTVPGLDLSISAVDES